MTKKKLTDEEVQDAIAADLEKRNLSIVALVCEDENNDLQVLSYGNNALINFISDPVESIEMNERLSGRMVRPIATIKPRTK